MKGSDVMSKDKRPDTTIVSNNDEKSNVLKLNEKPSDELICMGLTRLNRIIYYGDNFYIYGNNHYKKVLDDELYKLIFINEDWASYLNNARLANIKTRLKAKTILKANTKVNDSAYLNMQNGILNLETLSLETHTKDKIFTYIIETEYKKDVKSTILNKFIMDVLGEHQIILFKKMLGKILLQNNLRVEKAFLWLGTPEGANGKDTLFNLVQSAFQHATSFIDIASVENDRFGLSESFKDTLIAADTDYNEKYIPSSRILKNVVSGATITAEKKFVQARETFAPKCTIIVLTNNLPRIDKECSGGYYRRWSILKFNKTFKPGTPEYDPFIKEKLQQTEIKQAFINICIEGLALLKRDNYIFDDDRTIIEEWELENNPEKSYLLDTYTQGADEDFVPLQLLYDKYVEWAKQSGHKQMTIENISKLAKRIFNIDVKRLRDGGVRVRRLYNLRTQ